MLLAIEGLSVNYGGLAALHEVSVAVEEGQFVAIVGPNGAGKTTLFKAISGVSRPRLVRLLMRAATSLLFRRMSARSSGSPMCLKEGRSSQR
jgi:ABC-type branched-subunit amino acid transport system ATPase component